MPRIPKNPPVVLTAFVEYAREKEKKSEAKRAIETFEAVVEKRWNKFYEKMNENAPEPKRRKVDPMTTVENAMKKVAAQVTEANGDENALADFRSKLIGSMPQQVQSLLQPSLPADILESINQLCQKTEESKQSLQNSAGDSNDPVSKNALAIVDQVYSGLSQIKAQLEDKSAVDVGAIENEDEPEDKEDEPEDKDEPEASEVAPITVD